MKIEIKNKFLVFPINTKAMHKRVLISDGERPAFALNLKLDYINPCYNAYINVERYMGKTVEISCNKKMDIRYTVADEMALDNLYNEPLRPQVHFTTKNGWINDPNGLVYVDGVYHMFYQHNPAEPFWENMHWGHAESRDLIHWEEKDAALFPDEGGMIYSGSGIVDEKNLLGKNTDEHKAVLLYHTYTKEKAYRQDVAYSNDGCKTFTQYELGTAIPHMASRNRDPGINWCEELGAYIMLVFLYDGQDVYQLYKSENLKDWTPVQRIKINGDQDCPDAFPLVADDGKRKWVIMGAKDRYLVGTFENGCFNEEQGTRDLHFGKSAYAGQSFNNMPDGRVVRMVWDRWNVTSERFCGQMGVPMEMSLKYSDGTYYLCAEPVKELESLIDKTQKFGEIKLEEGKVQAFDLEDSAQLIRISGKLSDKGSVDMTVFGRKITLDLANNLITNEGCSAPLCSEGERFAVTIIVDRCSIEIFTDNGRAYIANLNEKTVMDRNLPYLELTSNEDSVIGSLEINSMKSIWGKK